MSPGPAPPRRGRQRRVRDSTSPSSGVTTRRVAVSPGVTVSVLESVSPTPSLSLGRARARGLQGSRGPQTPSRLSESRLRLRLLTGARARPHSEAHCQPEAAGLSLLPAAVLWRTAEGWRDGGASAYWLAFLRSKAARPARGAAARLHCSVEGWRFCGTRWRRGGGVAVLPR